MNKEIYLPHPLIPLLKGEGNSVQNSTLYSPLSPGDLPAAGRGVRG